jgi:hypothetical protein
MAVSTCIRSKKQFSRKGAKKNFMTPLRLDLKLCAFA